MYPVVELMVAHMLPITLILLLILPLLTALPSTASDPCSERACISVFTENNQIIIEARKGDTSVKKTISQAPKKPGAKPVPRPTAVPLFFPPTTKKPIIPKPIVKRTYKPRIKKTTTTVNLSDRLTKMVPTTGVAYQPEFEPLANVPVFFWCDLPSVFQSRVDIIGEIVDVTLRPSFTWSFGDGSIYSTTQNGGPYPNGVIRHSYSEPGNYVVTLLTTWNGTYTHNAQARAVTGTVKKLSFAAVTIVQAPTHFIAKKG